MREGRNILLCGVGGQGNLLAGEMIVQSAMLSGLDAKKSEIHGMAQRGGSVISHVRFSEKVFSPVIPRAEADILLALEEIEAVRYFDMLREDGIALINLQRIVPMTAIFGGIPYPSEPLGLVDKGKRKIYTIPALEIALTLKNKNVVNMVMVGALSRFLPFSEEVWYSAMKKKMKERFLGINRDAFEAGKGYLDSL